MSPSHHISFVGIPGFLIVSFLALLLAAPAAMAQVQFSGPTDYPVGTAPGTAAVGDFNGDDKPGIIPRGKEKSAPFRIVKEEASAYGYKSVGLDRSVPTPIRRSRSSNRG
jgi:hypothetical protein